MSWIEERAKFQKRFDELAQENVQGLITELNKAVGNYISKGGLSQDPNNNPDYNTIIQLTKRAENIKQRLKDKVLQLQNYNGPDKETIQNKLKKNLLKLKHLQSYQR